MTRSGIRTSPQDSLYGRIDLLELEERDQDAGAGKGLYHYIHPTDPDKMWCGCKRRSGGEITDPHFTKLRVDCIVCLDLRAMYGVDGWLALRDAAA